MLSTLNPACPLCGLRFENKPLLDLHIREDHRQRAFRGRADRAKTALWRALRALHKSSVHTAHPR